MIENVQRSLPSGWQIGSPSGMPDRLLGIRTDGSMTNTATGTRSVVVEREIAYPPEKIWRALTQPHLIEEWLMKNDFKPVVGHRFNLRGDWAACWTARSSPSSRTECCHTLGILRTTKRPII